MLLFVAIANRCMVNIPAFDGQPWNDIFRYNVTWSIGADVWNYREVRHSSGAYSSEVPSELVCQCDGDC